MLVSETPDWVADPAIAWRIVVTAVLTTPLTLDDARDRLVSLQTQQGWPASGRVLTGTDEAELRRRLGDERQGVVSLGLTDDGRRIVVSAHHGRVDGLGLLAVLVAVTGASVTSSARGVGDRPDDAGPLGTIARRLVEVALTPPARIASPSPSTRPGAPDDLDVYVERELSSPVRTAALVLAGARGVTTFNRAHAARRRTRHTRHVAVAIGVARDTSTATISDRSALLRLRDVERLDLGGITAALAQAPTQRPVHGTGGGAGLVTFGLRVLAPRLGSTLLVSHLGNVAADGIDALSFHPVTAGGSGVSLGALTLAGRTRVSLRARGDAWTHDGLEQLLEAVVAEIPS